MKKIFTLITMSVLALGMQASIYIVGSNPFGNWNTNVGEEMTDNGDGTYTWTGQIAGTIWFVFADGLTETAGDWDTFNSQYRFGPSTGSDQVVTADNWTSTQKQGNGSGAYQFAATFESSDYVITFDLDNMEFMIEGDNGGGDITLYTVAGTPISIFGTEWDPSNSSNDMTQQDDGTFVLTKYGVELAEGTAIEFKVVGNRDWGFAWPAENFYYGIDQTGVYTVTFTFNPNNKEVGINATLGEAIDTRTGNLFVLGEVDGNGWAPNVGVLMDTEDENIFTTTITTLGENIDENDGIGYSYFSFTSKLADDASDWNGIAAYRIGAIEDGYPLTEDQLGIELGLGAFGQQNSFKIPAGTYDLEVNLDAKTLVVTKAGGVDPTEVTYKIEKVWEMATPFASETTGDVRQGFGMNGKFYINNKADQKVVVIDENGIINTEYPGGANCGITRDEAGNLVVSNAAFPFAWNEATIKVINPETHEMKEYTVPEECGLQGRCDFIGFAKGNLMEDGALYLTGGTTGTDPFTDGVAVLTIAGGEVNVDECYTAACDGLVGQTSTVINYFKDINDEDALIYAYRSGNPSKLTFDGENLTATAVELSGKGHANGVFPFVWDEKEYYIYPIMPDYQNGFAIAEAGAEPIAVVESTFATNANTFQANWLNAEVGRKAVTIYQYYPGGNLSVYRLTKAVGGVDELNNDVEKVVSSVRYYNIMGQEVNEINGLTIVVTTYTDGSRSAIKVLR